jgi:2,3-bisphosphoglycerate-independent phosphoglycerate mutase
LILQTIIISLFDYKNIKRNKMKFVILLGDGMGDYPIKELGNKTILQAADIPHIRKIAGTGKVFLANTVPEKLPAGSDVANSSIMGFDSAKYYTGRAPIEAAGVGIAMKEDQMAFRCNLVNVTDNIMKDYSAGHITTEEAKPIVESLNKNLSTNKIRFVTSKSYRHLLIWDNGPQNCTTTPPHDITGEDVTDYLPKGPGCEKVCELMQKSRELLSSHPVSKKRISKGKTAPNQIWLWGQGKKAALPSYKDSYGLSGGIVSAVDLIRGIGLLAGLKADIIPGATGFIDTDFNAKVKTALKILETDDFVYVHIEAPDECGHMGRYDLKKQAVESFDNRVVRPIWEALEQKGQDYCLVIATDHFTPVSIGKHTREPIPIAVLKGPTGNIDNLSGADFDEFVNNGKSSGMAYQLMQNILKQGCHT